MQRLISVFLLVLLAGAAAAQAPAGKASDLHATLVKLERQGWELFKNKDPQWGSLCTPDYTAVFVDGSIDDLSHSLQAMRSFTINHYTLSDTKVIPLGPNAAVLTYTAVVNAAVPGGTAQDQKLAVTDVWVKRGGQWKSIRYHESPAK